MTIRNVALRVMTLGSRPGAAVLAVGACFFEPKTGKRGQTFYHEVGLKSAIAGSSLERDAQKAFDGPLPPEIVRLCNSADKKEPLSAILGRLADWMRAASGDCPVVWTTTQGELAVIEEAYRLGCVGLEHPWYHTSGHALTTLIHLAQLCVPKHSHPIGGSSQMTGLQHAEWLADSVMHYQVVLTPAKAPSKPKQPDFEDSGL